jgi:hypothetical protein
MDGIAYSWFKDFSIRQSWLKSLVHELALHYRLYSQPRLHYSQQRGISNFKFEQPFLYVSIISIVISLTLDVFSLITVQPKLKS